MDHSISIVGASGSGKTCFLAGLKFLSSSTTRSNFCNIDYNDKDTGEYQDEISKQFSCGKKPNPTNGKHTLCFSLKYNNFNIPIQTCDFTGEEFTEESNTLPADERTLRFLSDSEYILLLIDPEKDLSDNPEDEASRRLDAQIKTIATAPKNLMIERKIAFIITKADKIESENAEVLLHEKRSSFLEKCSSLTGQKNFRCFAVSSFGHEPDDETLPKPFGYEEVFNWILEPLVAKVRREKMSASILIALGIAVMVYFSAQLYAMWGNNNTVVDSITPQELIDAREKIGKAVVPEKKSAARKAEIDSFLERLSKNFKNLSDQECLTSIGKIKEWQADPADKEGELKTYREKLEEQYDNNRYETAKAQGTQEAYQEYLSDEKNVARKHDNEIRTLLDKIKKSQRVHTLNEEIMSIRKMDISTANTTKAKLAEIEKYMNEMEDERISKEERTKVKEICTMLSRFIAYPCEYNIQISQVKGLKKQKTTQIAVVYSDDADDAEKKETKEQENSKNSDTVSFAEDMYLRFPFGVRTTLEWHNKTRINYFIAKLIIKGPIDLFCRIDSWQEMTVVDSDFVSDPQILLRAKGYPGITKENIELVKKYVYPGTFWDETLIEEH